jgi:transposase
MEDVTVSTVVCRTIQGNDYILGLTPYRRESDKKPTSHTVSLGKIDSNTRKPLYNDRFIPWTKEHGLNPDTALKEFIERSRKKFVVDFTDHLMINNISNNPIDEAIGIANSFNDSLPEDDIPYYSNNDIKKSKKCFYGSIYLLNYLAKTTGLDDILTKVFYDEAEKIKALVYYNILDRRSLMYCPSFINNYDIPLSPIELSSQRISEILRRILEQDTFSFYRSWAEKISDTEYLALDSTSISSYSLNLNKAAFGFNKQREKLKQVNISFMFGEESGLPVYIQTYNGSLHDVSTLQNSIARSSLIQNKSFKFVLDRGFYSKKNINHLLFSDYKSDFLVGLPATTQLNKDLIKDHKYILDDINYAIQVNGDSLFSILKKVKWDKRYLNALIYVDPKKNDFNRNTIISEINMMYDNACQDPESYIDDPDYRFALRFRKSSKQPNGYIIKKNNDAYKEFRSRNGWFILLSNCESDTLRALEIYRKRDVVEKAFNIIKNFQNDKRTRVHDDDAYDSKVFIGFLSMILISSIHNTMKEHNLYKNKTMDEFFNDLSAIKAVVVKDKYIIDPYTKQVKDYYKFFKCPLPE